jgi:hypothetical protein
MRSNIMLLLSAVILLFLVAPVGAKTIDVGTSSNYAYTDPASGVLAASSGDVVHVHSGTYTISSPILMTSGVTLYGDGVDKTIIKMSSHDKFKTSASPGAIVCSSVSNVLIYGLSVTGGESSLSSMHSLSNSYRDYCRGINMRSCTNVTIHDFNYYLGMGDCIFGSSTNDVTIYNCVFNTPGHDGIDCWSGNNWHIYNVKVNTFMNSGIKLAAATNCKVDHITVYSDTSSGYCGVEIMESGNSITIDHCVFGPMGNSVSDGVMTDNADGTVGGTCAITNTIFCKCTGTNYGYNGAHTLTFTTSNIQTTNTDQTALWASEGFGYGSTGYSNGTTTDPAYNGSALPTLTSPSNGETLAATNGKVTFSWSDVNSTAYHLQVSNNSGFTSLISDDYPSTPSFSVAVQNQTVYWRVAAHIDAGSNAGNWTGYTASWSAIVSGNAASLSGVYGTVYDTAVGNPIKGAVVYIWANVYGNWSASFVTGENGQYYFDIPSYLGDDVYCNIVVSATGYQSSVTLPLQTTSQFQGEDIALTQNPSYFSPNYVTFTVIDMTGTTYSNVSTYAYKGTDTSVQSSSVASGYTDYQGNIVFAMDKNIQYTVTFSDSTQNINTKRTVTPSDNMYWVVVWGAVKNSDNSTDQNAEPTTLPKESDLVYVDSGYGDKNGSHATIYWWTNNTDQYSQILYWTVRVVEFNVSTNMPVMSPDNNSLNFSATVTGSGNASVSMDVLRKHTYRVYWEILDDQVGHTIYNYKDLAIEGSGIDPYFDFGFQDMWNYEVLGYTCMLLVGGLFGQRNVNVGAMMMMFLGGFFTFIGWFPHDTGQLMMMSFGCLLVLVYSYTRRD